MNDEEEIPIEFIRRVYDILDLSADDDGNYRPPPLSKPVVLYKPIDLAKRVLLRFGSIHGVYMAYRRHAKDREIETEVKRLAQLMWADDQTLTIAAVTKRIHAKLKQDGYRPKLSTCRTHASAVHEELGLPQRQGPRRKKTTC